MAEKEVTTLKGMAPQSLWRGVLFVSILFTASATPCPLLHSHSMAQFLRRGQSMVLQAGRVSQSPIQWESVSSDTQNYTRDCVPLHKLHVLQKLQKLQKELDQAVESKDYRLAACLKQKLESAEREAPVEKEVERKAFGPGLSRVVNPWLSSDLYPWFSTLDGQITGEDCRTIAMGTWNRTVAGEEEARADQLKAAESLVQHILMRAAHLGHRKVVISPFDIHHRPNNLQTWTVHQEMAPAVFLAAASQQGEDDSSSSRTVRDDSQRNEAAEAANSQSASDESADTFEEAVVAEAASANGAKDETAEAASAESASDVLIDRSVSDVSKDQPWVHFSAARNAAVATFAGETLEKGRTISCLARKNKVKYSTLGLGTVEGAVTRHGRPLMSSIEFVEHAAATLHEHEATKSDLGLIEVRFGAHRGWILGRNAGLKSTLEALAREWCDAGECLHSAYELSHKSARLQGSAKRTFKWQQALRRAKECGEIEDINVASCSYQHTDSRSRHPPRGSGYPIPDFLAMYPSLPWDRSLSFFEAVLALLDQQRVEGELTAQQHRTASEQVVLAGRFLREQLDFESTLSAGGPEALAALLLSDPVGSLMLCWRLQRAGFCCQLADAATEEKLDTRSGCVLTVDLMAPLSAPVQDLAFVLAENMDEMGWG